jgi:hypothetical protein
MEQFGTKKNTFWFTGAASRGVEGDSGTGYHVPNVRARQGNSRQHSTPDSVFAYRKCAGEYQQRERKIWGESRKGSQQRLSYPGRREKDGG